MSFVPETPFRITDDLVYCLRTVPGAYKKGVPLQQNDVSLSIGGTRGSGTRHAIARVVCDALNAAFPVDGGALADGKPERSGCDPAPVAESKGGDIAVQAGVQHER